MRGLERGGFSTSKQGAFYTVTTRCEVNWFSWSEICGALFGMMTGRHGLEWKKNLNSIRCLKGCEIYACFKWKNGLQRVLFKAKIAPLNANRETMFFSAEFP